MFQFDGTDKFELSVTESESHNMGYMGYRSLMVFAEVVEEHTGNTANDTQSFMLYQTMFKASPVEPLPFYFEKSREYTFSVSIDNTDQNISVKLCMNLSLFHAPGQLVLIVE